MQNANGEKDEPKRFVCTKGDWETINLNNRCRPCNCKDCSAEQEVVGGIAEGEDGEDSHERHHYRAEVNRHVVGKQNERVCQTDEDDDANENHGLH